MPTTDTDDLDLTAEELAELADLEKAEEDRRGAEAKAAKRQHLEAMRAVKRLTAKLGKPGHAFAVLETTCGNIVIRKPKDVEIDKLDEGAERPALEELAAAIVVEPDSMALQALMAEEPGLAPALLSAATRLLKVQREEEAKK